MAALVVGAEGHAAHLQDLAEGLGQGLAGGVERLREEGCFHEAELGFLGEFGAIALFGPGDAHEGFGIEGLKLVPCLLKFPSAFNLFLLF